MKALEVCCWKGIKAPGPAVARRRSSWLPEQEATKCQGRAKKAPEVGTLSTLGEVLQKRGRAGDPGLLEWAGSGLEGRSGGPRLEGSGGDAKIRLERRIRTRVSGWKDAVG